MIVTLTSKRMDSAVGPTSKFTAVTDLSGSEGLVQHPVAALGLPQTTRQAQVRIPYPCKYLC